MIPSDARSKRNWTGGVLDDPRVLHYWDEKKKLGHTIWQKTLRPTIRTLFGTHSIFTVVTPNGRKDPTVN